MEKEILKVMEEKARGCIQNGRHEMNAIRTGRASPIIVEDIKIDVYGTQMPLKQVAGISVPDPQSLLIQPWDKSVVGEIQRALVKSDKGFNPVVAGDVIRIPIQPLSEERRKELVKVAHTVAEECRVKMRALRHKAREKLGSLKDNGDISEDAYHRAKEKVQELTDKYIAEVDKVLKEKEKEIMEV